MLLFCLLLLGSAAFAAEFTMSFGGGFEFFGDWTTATTQFDADITMPPIPFPVTATTKSDQTITDLNYGGYLFFDATYVQLNVSFYGGSTSLESENNTYVSGNKVDSNTTPFDKTTSSMSIGLLGKYPFELNKFTLFPMIGVSYQIFFSGAYGDDYAKNSIETKASDFNSLWFNVGGGVNYALTEKIFINFEALYGFKLMPTEYDKNSDDFIEGKDNGKRTSGWVNTFTARLGVGYRFK